MESSWYFARFACADADTSKLDERADYWMPVDQYIGGIEHAILHLMYARFYQKLMNEAGLAKAREPFANLLTQGMVVAPTFFRDDNGAVRYHAPAEVEVEHDAKGGITGAHLLADGLPVEVGPIEKMAKSKNNGVDPERMIARYGADTVRLYIIETSPPDQMLEWSDRAVEGASKFLRRLWRIVREHVEQGPAPDLDVKRLDAAGARAAMPHPTRPIAKVSDDVGRPLQVQHRVRAAWPRARQRRHGVRREHRRPQKRRARSTRIGGADARPGGSPRLPHAVARARAPRARHRTRRGRWPTRRRCRAT